MDDQQSQAASRSEAESGNEIRSLSETQRRVLGTLLEKGFCTPANYPLTLSALVSGCSQKSNRDPVIEYDDHEVQEALEELEKLELTKTIYPDSGYAERFRHCARQRFSFDEPQLAIMTELWLRGAQTLGELRTRASRMVPINSLDGLKEHVGELIKQGVVISDGDLSKRGVRVDHTFYEEREGHQPLSAGASGAGSSGNVPSEASDSKLAELEAALKAVIARNEELHQALIALRREHDALVVKVENLG